MHNWWDDINIDRYNCVYPELFDNIIRYDKYYTTKLSILDMPIIDYLSTQSEKLAIIFTLINSGLIKPSIMIQILFIHINFISFLRNVKEQIIDC